MLLHTRLNVLENFRSMLGKSSTVLSWSSLNQFNVMCEHSILCWSSRYSKLCCSHFPKPSMATGLLWDAIRTLLPKDLLSTETTVHRGKAAESCCVRGGVARVYGGRCKLCAAWLWWVGGCDCSSKHLSLLGGGT